MPNFAILSNNTAIIGKPYLIAIVDPDAPSPPNRNVSQFLHFIGKGKLLFEKPNYSAILTSSHLLDYVSPALTNGTLFILSNTSAAIEEYFPPTPPAGSIAHR